MKTLRLYALAAILTVLAFPVRATDFFPIPQTPGASNTAMSFVANAASGNNAFVMKSGARLCLDGTTCSARLRYDTGAGWLASDGPFRAQYLQSQNYVAANTLIPFNSGGPLDVKGWAENNAAGVGLRFMNVNALADPSAKIASFYSDNGATERAYISSTGGFVSLGGGLTTATGFFEARSGSGAPATILGSASDGASATAVILNNRISLNNSGAKLLSVRNNGVEKLAVNKDGGILSSNFVWSTSGFRANGSVTVNLTGQAPDGATAVGVVLDNSQSFVTSGAKLISIRNNGAEKAHVDRDGNIVAGSLGGGLVFASKVVNEQHPIYAFFAGPPDGAAKVLRIRAATALNLPANLTGSQVDAGVAATGATTLTVKVNGVQKGTLVWAAAGTVPTVTFTATDIAVGDLITIENQATADLTLADISVTLLATTR